MISNRIAPMMIHAIPKSFHAITSIVQSQLVPPITNGLPKGDREFSNKIVVIINPIPNPILYPAKNLLMFLTYVVVRISFVDLCSKMEWSFRRANLL